MKRMLHAALKYGARGWPVIPIHSVSGGCCSCKKGRECEHPAKHPRTEHGSLDGSVEQSRIRRWWNRWPDANIGIVTGARAGLVVLDIDPRNGGDESFDHLTSKYGRPETLQARSGGGGRHIVFAHPR